MLMSGVNPFLRSFGRQLRIFRKQKLMSQEELAGRVGIPVNEIKDIEEGKLDPKLSMVLFIAQELNNAPEDLLVSSKEQGSEYYVHRFYLLQLLNKMSTKELKKAAEIICMLSTGKP